MQNSSKIALVDFLVSKPFETVLDVPSGNGWLKEMLPPNKIVDGIDLFEEKPLGYRNFWQHDLDHGLPEINENYDLICCCEGIEHVGNPLSKIECRRVTYRNNAQYLVSTI